MDFKWTLVLSLLSLMASAQAPVWPKPRGFIAAPATSSSAASSSASQFSAAQSSSAAQSTGESCPTIKITSVSTFTGACTSGAAARTTTIANYPSDAFPVPPFPHFKLFLVPSQFTPFEYNKRRKIESPYLDYRGTIVAKDDPNVGTFAIVEPEGYLASIDQNEVPTYYGDSSYSALENENSQTYGLSFLRFTYKYDELDDEDLTGNFSIVTAPSNYDYLQFSNSHFDINGGTDAVFSTQITNLRFTVGDWVAALLNDTNEAPLSWGPVKLWLEYI